MKKNRLLIGFAQLLWGSFLSLPAWSQKAISGHAPEHHIKAQIDRSKLPAHVAIIMDGNGRWATKQGKPRVFGHQNAIKSVREVIEGCDELGISYLTLYVFSKDNWKRPQIEVDSLMDLMATVILTELVQSNLRPNFIGNLSNLPPSLQRAIRKAQEACQHNQGLFLTIAINYSGDWDLAEAAKAIARDVQAGSLALKDIDTDLFKRYLATKDIPEPELLIRTSGEMRLSNFLLGQLAYTELFFTPILWPDFRKCDLYEAILAYQKRKRRFGNLDA